MANGKVSLSSLLNVRYEREADVKIMFTKWCQIARPTISGMKIMQTDEIFIVIHSNGG